MTKTNTPRTDACPHCGAEERLNQNSTYYCGSWKISTGGISRTDQCRALERVEKAESEVERLKAALQSCYWATNTYDGNYTRACDNVATIAIAALKTQEK